MIADLGNLDRSSVPTMVTSIDLATEHPLISVAVAKHRFLFLAIAYTWWAEHRRHVLRETFDACTIAWWSYG